VRLLILSQYYAPEIGAAQARLTALASALIRRGHDVEVVTAMPNHLFGRTLPGYRHRLYMREVIDGVRVHRTWIYVATGTGTRRIASYLSFAGSSLIGLLRARRPDAIFVESPPLFLAVPGWIAAKVRRCPLIFNVADLWPDAVRELGVMSAGPLLRVAERLEAWTYRRATMINVVTQGIAHRLRENKRVPASKLRFLPNGVDVETFAPRARSGELAARLELDERPVFLYVGTHGIAHALDHLIAAAAQVPEALVLLVGAGTTKSTLVELARDLENVRFIDPVPLEEMSEYFSLAYASIVPLVRCEVNRGARPSKLFASLACGVPVIYSGEGEGAAIVTDAHAGLVVPPEDSRAIANAMRRLIDDPVQRDEMAKRARDVAVERFAWPGIVDRWLASL
jgi:colanic acid biosynthesis glycosyl transferase WcaI